MRAGGGMSRVREEAVWLPVLPGWIPWHLLQRMDYI